MNSVKKTFVLPIATVGSALVMGAGLLGCGCSGTSPQLAAPSLNAPNPNTGRAADTGSRTAADEAKLAPLDALKTPSGLFFAEPYLQLGTGAKAETLALLWQTPLEKTATPAVWSVETRPAGAANWKSSGGKIGARTVAVDGVPAHHVWSASLSGLRPGALFDYRLSRDKVPVFTARARARRAAGDTATRFVVFGDCAAGTVDQKKIAFQTSLVRPDFVFITGDIVYQRGLVSEYQKNFFPVYNADEATPETGAPLLRSTLFVAAPGNHDLEYRTFETYPDALAYFYYWSVPSNGPNVANGAANTPRLSGPEAAQKAFLAGSGDAYPRAANYSFDYGNTHWTVLDSDPYVDWSDPSVRSWLEKDLAGAKSATWRFVAFHHPPFNSSTKHRDDQQMRVICDLLQKYRVDVVWSGHVHNYQRTHPLTFAAVKGAEGKWRDAKGRVEGKWTLDTAYDGEKKTKPDGVLYVITGAGGAGLYDPDIQQKPNEWLPFTAKYIADTHSFTQADVSGTTLTVRQISDAGKELDTFILTK